MGIFGPSNLLSISDAEWMIEEFPKLWPQVMEN